MIETTDRKAIAAGQTNIRVALRDFVKEGSGLPGAAADYAMLFNILHAPDPLALLREAFRLLRSEGKIAAMHWNPTDTPRGPDLAIRPRPDQMRHWIEEAGFRIVLPPIPLPPYHYELVGEKP